MKNDYMIKIFVRNLKSLFKNRNSKPIVSRSIFQITWNNNFHPVESVYNKVRIKKSNLLTIR